MLLDNSHLIFLTDGGIDSEIQFDHPLRHLVQLDQGFADQPRKKNDRIIMRKSPPIPRYK